MPPATRTARNAGATGAIDVLPYALTIRLRGPAFPDYALTLLALLAVDFARDIDCLLNCPNSLRPQLGWSTTTTDCSRTAVRAADKDAWVGGGRRTSRHGV